MAEKEENLNVDSVKSDTSQEVIGPSRGGFLKRTLEELEKLDIQLKDVFSIEGSSINLSWTKVIRLVNYNAGKTVLRWDHTFEEALQIIKIFL